MADLVTPLDLSAQMQCSKVPIWKQELLDHFVGAEQVARCKWLGHRGGG
jgi:hypothetical protein